MKGGRAPWDVVAVCGVIAVGMVLGLWSMGRVWWCACGSPVPWAFEVMSQHNSQHVLDAYSPTHVLHGVLFYAVLAGLVWGLGLGARLPVRWRLPLALLAEGAWELVENTQAVIDRYRESTISLDYYGDSIANSVSDLVMCALGFLLAARLPWWASLGLFLGSELLLGWLIRDGLLLNMLMLVYPLEAVRLWQAG